MTWALATIAALLIGYATVSRRLEGLNVSGAIFFTTAGLLAGLLGLVDLEVHGEQVKLLAEITLTLVLFADASRISLRALRHESAVPLRLLGIGLPLTIVTGAVIGAVVVPGISFAEALVLAIVLACTDAALGQAVVSDERVPSRIRQGLNVESGLNDGLCVPLFFIAIAFAETDAGTASSASAAELVFEQIGYGLVGGVLAGVLGGVALRFGAPRRLVEPHWLQILSVASALLAAGIATALGGSIFIAAFTGGFLFGALRRDTSGEVTYLVDEGGELFNAVTFIVFGAVILGPMLDEVTWQIVLYAILSLTVVRMLPVALALLGTGARRPTVAFLGWFGPRGLASIVFAVILTDDTELPHLQTMLLAITVTIALSVYVHGVTARPLTERYARWFNSHPRNALPAMESVAAAEHRLRTPSRSGQLDDAPEAVALSLASR
jgi:sodium/hydrogen antiporter